LISSRGIGNWRFSAPNLSFLFQPWHILLAALFGMVNQWLPQIIEFQNAQNMMHGAGNSGKVIRGNYHWKQRVSALDDFYAQYQNGAHVGAFR
jgi:hypothetical protein